MSASIAPPPAADTRTGIRRARLLEAGGVTLALLIAATLFGVGVSGPGAYDEGVYLESLKVLDHGQSLGGDVFASQPPGFYLLLRVAELAAGSSLNGIRAAFLVVAVGGLLAVYLIGRALGGPLSGLVVLGVLATAPPYPLYAARVFADEPATALALVVIALALYSRGGRERLSLAFASGAVFVLALSVKLLVAPAAVTLLAIWLTRPIARRSLLAAAAGAATVAACFAVAYAGALGELWSQSVGFHAGRHAGGFAIARNLGIVKRYLEFRTPFAWLVVAALILALYLRRRGVRVGSTPLWLGAAAALAFLAVQRPLLHHHLVYLSASLALPVGVTIAHAVRDLPRAASRRVTLIGGAGLCLAASVIVIGNGPVLSRGRLTVAIAVVFAASAALLALSWRRAVLPRRRPLLGVLVVLALAGVAQEAHRLRRNTVGSDLPAAQIEAAAAVMRDTSRPDELVFTDQPIIAYQANRRLPAPLVDTSSLRVSTGSLTPAAVIAEIRRADIHTVAIGRALAGPALETYLRQEFREGPVIGPMRFYLRRTVTS